MRVIPSGTYQNIKDWYSLSFRDIEYLETKNFFSDITTQNIKLVIVETFKNHHSVFFFYNKTGHH